MASEEKKVYPGSLDRYSELREKRIEAETSPDAQEIASTVAALSVAEELAGLAYILDGIRYTTRQNRSS